MPKEPIQTDAAPAAIGPYSQAIQQDSWLYCSGQVPINPASGKIEVDSVADQTQQVLKNLSKVLEAASSGLDQVVKTTIYVQDMNDFATVNEVYAGFFKAPFPARATVQVAGLPLGAKVEIDAVAKVSK